MKQFISTVIELKSIAEDYFLLSFTWIPDSTPAAGQFLTIRTTELSSPLLRRPFALSSFDNKSKTASIIFQKRGEGTKIMSQLIKGDKLDIMGPLGNSFSDFKAKSDNTKKKQVIVAGGIGTGPMLYLAEEMREGGIEPLLIVGCRTKSLIPFSSFNKNIETVICTDDGSFGFKGNVIDYMNSNDKLTSDVTIYCCGPEPMRKSCHAYAETTNNTCYVSLEQMMACGIGACMGCTCETEGEKKYARVCKDGPVFKSSEVKWT